ncbi:hypothetical protein FWG86_00695 [Candidatus Saccharibacteria bacterium]|nr:hypothetical protein [Candidatus Saccharibacteria bacterium]
MKSKVLNVDTASPEFRAELGRRLELAKNPKNRLSLAEARKLTERHFQLIRTKRARI